MSALGDEEIGWLDVAMDDPLSVSGIERVSHLDRDLERGVGGERPACEPVAQRLALEPLHHDEERALRLADVMDRTDVGMIQRRRCPRFPLESPQTLPVAVHLGRQDLDGDFAPEARVARGVHLAHAAGADERDDLVGPKPCAWRQCHRKCLMSSTSLGAWSLRVKYSRDPSAE